jgi:hypothetical protein
MAHEERSHMLTNKDAKFDNLNAEQKTVVELLADANTEIEDLKLQIAWLERSYE